MPKETLSFAKDLSDGQLEALDKLLTSITPSSEGIEEDEEIVTPRIPALKIKHAMSSDPGCPDDATNGDLYLTGIKIENPARVIPVYFYRSRILFEGGSGAIACFSPNAVLGSEYGKCGKRNSADQCVHSQWVDNRPPHCQETINAIVLFSDLSGVAHVRFSKSSFSAGKTMMALAKSGGRIWNRQQFIKAVPRQAGKNKYHAFEVSTAGVDTDTGARKIAEHICSKFAESRKSYIEDWKKSLLD
jgi:hypothetical protein